MVVKEKKKNKFTEGIKYRFMDQEYASEEALWAAIADYAAETYDDFLRDIYGDRDGNIDICGLKYDAAYALEKVDPIAYRVGVSDYEDSLNDNVEEIDDGIEESIKPVKEAPYYELSPRYDSRKSFYGKAHVDTGDNNDKNKLWSYDTLVAEIKDGKPVVYGTYSATTLRHIKDWLKQNGFKADTAKQIMQDYGVTESLHEGWRGSDKVDIVSHGEWADPDLVYNGYTFNYWDIEDALWGDFLAETGYKDSDSNNPKVEAEFDEYVRDRAPGYLDDVIYGGYFDKGSKSWHDRYR